MTQENSCFLCRGSSRASFEKHGHWIHECEICHHLFVPIERTPQHVTQVYDDGYFSAGGTGYPGYLGGADLLTAHGRRYGDLLKRFMEPGEVLDVGSAAGFILKGLEESGWKGYGVEPNRRMAEYASSALGVQVEVGTLEQLQTTRRYDLVAMIQVVAHLYDLRKAFQVAADITKPGGFWLIETSDRSSLIAQLLGKNWHMYSPPSVVNYFTPAHLSALVKEYGFEEVARGRPTKWLKGNHVKSLIKYKLEGSRVERLGTLIRRLLPDGLPVPYPSFDLFWAIYQKKLTHPAIGASSRCGI